MDKLGERLIRDEAIARNMRMRADECEKEAKRLRREADEIDRLADLARLEK